MRMITMGAAAGLGIFGLAACTPAARTVPAAVERPVAGTATAGPIDTALSAEQVVAARAITSAPAPRPSARATAAQLDTTTTEQRTAAAKAPEAAETRLGSTVASLGNPTEGGFWIKTPLVKARGIGRLVNPATGKSAKVDLIPLDGPVGGGSQVSLPALQLLGVSLTDLPTLEVYKS